MATTNTRTSEDARLASLEALAILDTPQEERFDRLTRLVSQMLSTPIALVSLVAAERQWFKSRVGLDATETPRSMAFCSHSIDANDMMVVEDARLDPRFAHNPLVTGAPFIRFYAGQPVFSHDGQPVGTLCVIDSAPRELDAVARQTLRDFAMLVQDEMNKASLVAARDSAEAALRSLNEELESRIVERTRSLNAANQILQGEIGRRELVESTLRTSEQRIRTIIDTSLVAFVCTDATGLVVDWNRSAERTFGWMRDEVLGVDLATLIIPERHRDAHRAGMRRVMAGGAATVINKRLEMPALSRDRGEIVVAMTINTFESNQTRYFGAFLYDISDEQKAQSALQRERALLEQKQELLDAILETVDVGIVACDASGAVSLFNRAAREFHGLSPEGLDAVEWARHYSLYGADGVTLLTSSEIPLSRALQGETLRDVPLIIAPDDLQRRFVLASGRRLSSAAGQPLGAVIALKDMTEASEVQRRLARNEERLRDITDNVPALIGHIDSNLRFTFLNTPALRFYGKSGQRLIGEHVSSIYSPAQFDKFGPLIARALQGERVHFEGDIDVGGKRKYFHASYIPDIDAAGAVRGFYALALDITARKHSELQQSESEERLRMIADNLPVLIAYLDLEQRYQFANALYRAWLGKDPADMLGRTVTEVFGQDFQHLRAPYLNKSLEGQVVHHDFEIDGEPGARIVNTAFIPHMRGGEVVGTYLFSTDVTAARRNEASMHTLANTDALTGLPNRRSYEAALRTATSTSQDNSHGIALMFLDIDRFKEINDTFGHATGDEVLREFSRRLLAVVRKSDRVSRLAGDEFTILLVGVPAMHICQGLGEKILHAMQTPFQIGGRQLPVTTSVGIAWSARAHIDARRLGESADAALYKAKQAGRNRYFAVEVG